MIEPKDLKVGDILLLKDKTHHFYRHVSVVTEVDVQNNIYKVMHWRGVGEPYAITEVTLPSAESFAKRNVEFECFRMHDENQAVRAVDILRSWLGWAVPYDKSRFARAEIFNNQFFSVSSDLFNGISPHISSEYYDEKVEENRKEMEALFVEHYMDIVKYAARSSISPVRPKRDGEKQTGFHCLQGIMLAYQVSYALDFVNPVSDRWLANKHTDLNSNLAANEPRFESVNVALKPEFDSGIFLATFPPAFRLYAKLCPIDTFRHAIWKDERTFRALGALTMLAEANIKPDAETMLESARFFKRQGDQKRKALLETVITLSIIKNASF